MELQADTKIMQEISNKACLSYLETLLHLSKKEQHPTLALSFALKNSMTDYRIRTAIKYNYYHKNVKTTLLDLLPLELSIVILLFSFGYDAPYSCSAWHPIGFQLRAAVWHIQALKHFAHQGKRQ